VAGPKEDDGNLVRGAIRASRRVAFEAGFFSLFVNLLMLTGPLYMMQVYDRILSSRSYETLFVITLLVVVLFAAMAALDFSRTALLARTAATFEERLKGPAFELALDSTRYGAPTPEQPLKDLRQIRQFIASPGLVAVFDAPWTPIYLLVVFGMHSLLGAVTVIGLAAILALSIANERASRAANEAALRIASDADRLAAAALRNSAAVDAMGMRGVMKNRWSDTSAGATAHAVHAGDVIGGFASSSRALRLFLQSAILGAGAYLAIQGELSPGAMIAAAIIAGRALAPVEAITAQWKSFAQTSAAYKRLKGFFAAAPAAYERTPLPRPLGAISVERLYCQPGNAKRPVVKGVSFAIAPGEAIGIIGPSAAGKSTLARALVGVERCISGEIRLDGAELSQWSRDELGRHVGYLPQEVELFAGTAAQNIARFRPDAKAEQVIAAAEAAGAHAMILQFAGGYDAEIGEGGKHLSAGQRQRLGLARALFGDPALVVLDEPNSNLDAEGEAALAKAIRGLKARGATTIIVAHRPSAIAYVDKLLFLLEGELRAFGPRDDVLAQIAPKQLATMKRPAEETAANG
jgi:PrtD family type I secretion system ABC transporter